MKSNFFCSRKLYMEFLLEIVSFFVCVQIMLLDEDEHCRTCQVRKNQHVMFSLPSFQQSYSSIRMSIVFVYNFFFFHFLCFHFLWNGGQAAFQMASAVWLSIHWVNNFVLFCFLMQNPSQISDKAGHIRKRNSNKSLGVWTWMGDIQLIYLCR